MTNRELLNSLEGPNLIREKPIKSLNHYVIHSVKSIETKCMFPRDPHLNTVFTPQLSTTYLFLQSNPRSKQNLNPKRGYMPKKKQREKAEAHLAGPVVAVEVADEAVAGLGGGEELLLGDLPVLAVAEGAPLGPALGGAAHLQDPALAERLDVVRVEAVERGDLLVELVLHRLGHRQHLLLQDLHRPLTASGG